jgi:NCS1 family nucleobase:cation symporter-1
LAAVVASVVFLLVTRLVVIPSGKGGYPKTEKVYQPEEHSTPPI